MAINKDLAIPETDDEFEVMCHQLYRLMWEDPTCMRVGRSGQNQFGVDILAFYKDINIAIQCKRYVATKFTYSTMLADVTKADAENLDISHLLFATTAQNVAETVRQVHAFNTERRAIGKFTVSVDFWSDICGHIRMHPSIGRNFIPGYPGSAILVIDNTTKKTLATVEDLVEHSRIYAPTKKVSEALVSPKFKIEQKTFTNTAGFVSCELNIKNYGGQLNAVEIKSFDLNCEFPAIGRARSVIIKLSMSWPVYEIQLTINGVDANGDYFKKGYLGVYQQGKFIFD
ncbi:hypothetical protein ACFDR9_002652 [Janthinobacterium sp. CG_23.3]|uniref:restriction endonuclease n=1 Tax=Janthinobacterium sp. CG_23.3 TaxID=3349634 RepID=UPI0038D45D04